MFCKMDSCILGSPLFSEVMSDLEGCGIFGTYFGSWMFCGGSVPLFFFRAGDGVLLMFSRAGVCGVMPGITIFSTAFWNSSPRVVNNWRTCSMVVKISCWVVKPQNAGLLKF